MCMSASNSVLMPLIDVIIVAMARKCEAFTNHTFLLVAEKCTYLNSSTDLFFSSSPFSLLYDSLSVSSHLKRHRFTRLSISNSEFTGCSTI